MIGERYYVKIVPHRGERVHRFEVRRHQIAIVLGLLATLALGFVSTAMVETIHAHAQVSALREQTAAQQATLKQIDQQTETLRHELQHVQRQNAEIRVLIGAPPNPNRTTTKTSWVRGRSLRVVAMRVQTLSQVLHAMKTESDGNRQLAMRVLNIRHLRDIARARLIAAIPSIDPVDGAAVIGCFCYRSYPDVEFHKGVDLSADYGEPVRASAAGTVVANAWDGAYGIKIDIDHGNGYHTWYAHLSRTSVHVGDHVYKGETIAAVGATGFATGPHLHYQVMRDGEPVDPAPYLNGVPANVLASLP